MINFITLQTKVKRENKKYENSIFDSTLIYLYNNEIRK